MATAIDKHPVEGRVALGRLGFAGDEQADLRVHGGPDKAVCCYPSEHVPRWARLLERPALPPGAFGENLTLLGLTEIDTNIGDTYTLGEDGAVVQVSQPRGPCFKLAARWGKRTLTREMAHDMLAGFYLRVVRPGTVGAGDALDLVERVSDVSVAEVLRVTYRDRHDPPALRRVVAVPELADQWRASLARLVELDALPLRDPVGDA
ncbi:MAG TPA: MOSC domain-containing protein [Baekduia sp.]|nr:MOSC domain-containing protein [Baekduia sp.]